MTNLDTDAGDDWEAFLGVCEHMGGRTATQPERDRLYDCWRSDSTCQQAVLDVLGVVFVGAPDDDYPDFEAGLVHISTPMRTVDELIRRARAAAEIKQIIADAVGHQTPEITGIWFDEAPNDPRWPYVPDRAPTITGPSGWRGGHRAPLWWVLLGLAGAVGTGFLVATLAAVFH